MDKEIDLEQFKNVYGTTIRLFFRKTPTGTIVIGKILGELDMQTENEMVFNGYLSEDLVLSGNFRKPNTDKTESFSNETIMQCLGSL